MLKGKDKSDGRGLQLKRKRQVQNLSQAELSKILGVNQSTISRYERGIKSRKLLENRIDAYLSAGADESAFSYTEIINAINASPKLKDLIVKLAADL